MDGCRESNRNVRETVLLPEMFDVKAWMNPIMEKVHNPHIFRFARGSDGHSEMTYKHWNHDPWEPCEGPGLKLLKVCTCILFRAY